ncbi:unnamed protein product [Blepharisma stoltei]|uniref:F-box domain-containing protein n=1 Tax=Blepharisma stoltei TaxID=1481888 RepID=A0AAU9JWN1_9CILI|nr:unnamed protein product [Blepharisma stoltei]
MWDYKYGQSTHKIRLAPDVLMPRLKVSGKSEDVLLKPLTYMHGLDIIKLAPVCKSWYNVVWDPSLWLDLCNWFKHPDRMKALGELAEGKIKLLEKEYKRIKNMSQYRNEEDLAGIVGSPLPNELTERQKQGFRYRFIYAHLLFKTCFECASPENKLRFLPILRRSICYTCAKLPRYEMISHENAEIDYSVTKADLNKHEIEGLKVPDPFHPGKYMLVYYLDDILKISRAKSDPRAPNSAQKRELEDKRKTELIYLLKQENLSDRYIDECIYTEGTACYSYIQGKSRRPVEKIVATMKKKYEQAKAKIAELDDDEEEMPLPEADVIIPLKKPKLELSDTQKENRRKELTERLKLMGVNLEEIEMNDEDGIFCAYVNGRTKQDIGPVAGAIWRDHKPVFTGIPFRTCQRKEDLDMKIETNNYGNFS